MILSQAVSLLASADHGLMLRLHASRPPRWLRYWAIAATRCGDGWLWVLLGVHYLSDVLAGAAIGTGLAYAAVALVS